MAFWFRMASSATAVLPVWRSPMISSRWPRPIGISASTALRPVAIGSLTDLRGMMPGAFTSTRARLLGVDRALAVDRVAERVDDAAEQLLADRHVHDGAGALDGLAFADLAVGAEDHDADVVGFEVQRHAAHAGLELDHLAGLDVVEAVDAGDAVADGQDLADLGDLGLGAEVLDLPLEDVGNLSSADIHQPTSFMRVRIELSLVLIEASTMRLPSRTMMPPMISGSTFMSSSTRLAARGVGEGLLEGLELGVAERLRHRDLGARHAAVGIVERQEVADHRPHREEAALGGDEQQEVRREARDADPLEHGLQGAGLVVGREDGAADQELQVGVGIDQGVEALQIVSDPLDGTRFLGQREQGGGVTASHPGYDVFGIGHGVSPSTKTVQRVPGQRHAPTPAPWEAMDCRCCNHNR